MNKNDRTIFKDGNVWKNKRNINSKATSVHKTQKEAKIIAKQQIKKDGGGELTIKGINGKIRDKNTVAPGNDPFPPKDKR